MMMMVIILIILMYDDDDDLDNLCIDDDDPNVWWWWCLMYDDDNLNVWCVWAMMMMMILILYNLCIALLSVCFYYTVLFHYHFLMTIIYHLIIITKCYLNIMILYIHLIAIIQFYLYVVYHDHLLSSLPCTTIFTTIDPLITDDHDTWSWLLCCSKIAEAIQKMLLLWSYTKKVVTLKLYKKGCCYFEAIQQRVLL